MPESSELPVATHRTPIAGHHLTRSLRRIGITYTPRCPCRSMAAKMDRNGPDWCEANIEMIVDVMRAEAKKRKLPFTGIVARVLVRMAIRWARRDEKAGG